MFYVTSFSFSSASRVLNFFCTSLMSLNAVFKLEDGADISPGSLVFELRNVLKWGAFHVLDQFRCSMSDTVIHINTISCSFSIWFFTLWISVSAVSCHFRLEHVMQCEVICEIQIIHLYSQFFNKGSIGIWKYTPCVTSHSGARHKEIDSKICEVALYRLAYVLYDTIKIKLKFLFQITCCKFYNNGLPSYRQNYIGCFVHRTSYGWRVLRWVEIVPDKKKSWQSNFFSHFPLTF